MDEMISNLLDTLQIDELHTCDRMSVATLSRPDETGPKYLTMSQGFDQEVLTVEEISDSGSVPELSVINRGELHVLLLDGEEIRGAKQNRVLNTSILVAPGSKCTVPVSCTEQGRWHYTTSRFEDSEVVMAQSLRQRKQASVSKNVREHQSFHSDQGEVWEGVDTLHCLLDISSETGAMRDAYEARQEDLEKYVRAFADIRDVNGIAVFLEGKLAGLDFISYRPAMNDLLPKLIGSYAMDALCEEENGRREPDPGEVQSLLSRIGRCALEVQKSEGVGDDARLDGPDLQGAALIALNTVIHLSAFIKADEKSFKGGMSSFSHRRQFRDSM
ncbi:ARPP-1 family domain-containing protein [Geothermobacter hydrogeniphilus]|nr:DUF6569 family protein [Geothermobacter hydrogeniphilus]